MSALGALWRFITGNPEPYGNYRGLGNDPSYDWCRFRRRSHCYFPKELHQEATELEGCAVYVPYDRGTCPRVKWADQARCPVGEPGPNVQNGYMDATIPWEEGGQRGGIPTPGYRAPRGESRST